MDAKLNDKIKQLLERYEQIVRKETASKPNGFDLRELNGHLLKSINQLNK